MCRLKPNHVSHNNNKIKGQLQNTSTNLLVTKTGNLTFTTITRLEHHQLTATAADVTRLSRADTAALKMQLTFQRIIFCLLTVAYNKPLAMFIHNKCMYKFCTVSSMSSR